MTTTTNLPRGAAALVRFALPLFFTNLLQSVYNLADLMIVGRFLGSSGLAALSSASMVCYAIYSICTGIATGGGVLVAHYLGRGDRASLRKTAGALLSLSALTAIVITAAALLSYGPILRAMEVPPESLEMSRLYLSIVCFGTLFVLGYQSLAAVLRGMGDAKSPLLFLAVAAVFNVALDLVMVGPMDLGAAGAALATVLAQALSLLWAALHLWRRGFFRDFSPGDFSPRLRRWGAILRIGLPAAVQLSVVNLSYLVVTGMFNSCGTAAAAAAGVGLKLNTFAAMPCWAVGQAVTTMAGQWIGAGEPRQAAKIARQGLGYALLASAATVLPIFLAAPRLIALFDPSADVVFHGTAYLRLCCSFNFIAYTVMYVLDSFATGVGYAGFAMVNSLLHSVVIRLGLSWLLGVFSDLGFVGLCWAEMLSPFPCALAGLLFFCAGRWKKGRLV